MRFLAPDGPPRNRRFPAVHLSAFCYYRLVDKQRRVGKTDSKTGTTPLSRRDFLALPMVERRRILEAQAEQILEHYEKNSDWREIQGGDVTLLTQ